MKKFTKVLSVMLSVLLIWQSFGTSLGLKASASSTDEIFLSLGAATNSSGTYYYNNATVTGSGIKTILLSFSESVASGDKIILPTSTAGFTVSSTSASNDYTKRISIDTTTTGNDNAAAVQTYLRGISFKLAGTSQSVKVTITTENILYDTFYDVDTQHYYQYVPFTTTTNATWVDAYNAAENMEYMNRSGYLATVTSYDEDVFLNSLSNGSVGWLGGTALTNTGESANGENGSLYYSGFDTGAVSGNNWYWADGPERGRVFYYGRSTDRSSNSDGTDPYWNWGNSTEPNGNTSITGENCLSTLNRLSIDNQRGYHGTDFSWNDIVWNTENEGDFSAKGFFVEYGNLALGSDETVDASKYASDSGSLDATYTASISGSPVYGHTLTAELTGGNDTDTLAYQWTRDDGDISGATNQTYTLTSADVGHKIAVKITDSDNKVTSPTVNVTGIPISGSGSALSFDGSDDYVGIPSSSTYTTSSFTVEAWVQYDTSQSWSGIVDKGRNTGKNWYVLSCDGDARGVVVGMQGAGELSYNWGDNGWHHVCIAYDGNTFSLYVDGILRGSETASGYAPTDSTIAFGRRQQVDSGGGNLKYFIGQLDEVKIWNTARNQDEVRSDMYSRPASGASGLVGYWNFDEGSGSTAADSSGYGCNGTLTNMDTSSCWADSGAWQSRTTAEGTALTIDAGYSLDGGSVTIAQSSAPSHGTLTFDSSAKTVTYTPASRYYRSDTFTYTVTETGVSKSYTVDMTVVQKPDVTVGNQTATVGGTATFSADASVSDGGALSYQWQKNKSGTWTDISGATSANYTTGTLAMSDSGGQYRCIVTNTIGFTPAITTSDAVTLTVFQQVPTLSVTASPDSPQGYPADITLSATLGGYYGTLSGQTICFYDGVHSDPIGSATTNSSGVASFDWTKPDAAGYSITAEFAGDTNNTSVTSSAITYGINKGTQATLTVDDPGIKTYGDSSFKLSVNGGSGTGALSYASSNESVLTVDGDGNATIKGAGTAKITVTKAGDSNYNASNTASVTITVNKAALTATVGGYSKTYGDANPSFTINVSGFKNGETATTAKNYTAPTATCAATGTTGVGTVAITLSGGSADNYTFNTSDTGTLTIDPIVLTPSAAANSKTYDGGTDTTGTISLSGIINNDSVTANGTFAFADKDAGTGKTVNVTGITLSGSNAGNYTLSATSTATTANINRCALTVSVSPVTILCGQQIPDLTVNVSGFITGESESLSGFAKPMASQNYGSTTSPAACVSLPVTYSGGDATNNYKFDESDTTTTLTIQPVYAADGDYSVTPAPNANGWNDSDPTITPQNGYDLISTDGTDWKSALTVSTEASNGSITFKLKKSSDGTQTESKTIYYNLDKTVPNNVTVKVHQNSFTTFLNTITFGLFFKNDVDVTLSASDVLSGVDYYEYQLVDTSKGQSYNEENTWTRSDSGIFGISPQFKGAVYAYAVDKAGNKSAVISSNGFVADNQIPAAPNINATEGGNSYSGSWTSGDVKLVASVVSGSMPLSGIDYYEYSMDNGDSWTKMPTESGTTDGTSGNAVADTLTITSDMNGKVYVRAVSNSGMAGSESTITIQRDSVTPVLGVSVSGTTGQWTNSPVTFTLSNTASNISPVTYRVKIGSGDWTQISGNTVNLTTDTDTTYQFKAVSGSGLESDASTVYTVKLDVNDPVILGVSGNPVNWTNSDATLTVNASDDSSGIKEYSFDGGTTWQGSASNTYSSNTTIPSGKIKVKDTAGNITSYNTDIVITKIDKTAPASPTITITSNPVKQILHTIFFGLFFNNTVDVTLSSTDNLSAIKNYEYQLVSEGGALADNAWTTCSTTFCINPQFKGTIYARAADNAGNISAAAQSDKFVTDKNIPTAPVIEETVSGNAYDGSSWTSGNIKLAASGSTALSGIGYYEYSTDNGGSWTKMEGQSQTTDGTSGQYINDTQTISTDMNGSVLVRAVSNSGINGEKASVAVKRDAAIPLFNVSVSGTVGSWTGTPVTFTFSNTAGNLSPITYWVKTGSADWVQITGNTYTFSKSMNETCQFKAVSAAGCEATSGIYAVMIDANLPTVSVTGNPTDWTKQDAALSIDAECSPYGVQSVTVSKDGESAVDITGQSTYTVTENGSYVFTAANRAGSTVSKTVSVTKIDKAAPTGMTVNVHTNSFTGFLHTITFGLFFNNTIDITLSAGDELSGISHYEYQLVDTSKGQTYNANGIWTESDSGTLSIDPQFKGVIYARAIDKAGNVTASDEIVQTDGFAVDNQKPTVPTAAATVNGDAYNSGWTSGSVKIVASASTALSGICRYEYKIGDSGTWTALPDQSGAIDSTTGNAVADTLTIASDMNDNVHIRAVSNSGIEGNDAVVTVKRDTVTPSLQITVSGTTGQWTEDPVTFTLSNTANNISPVTYWVKIGSEGWTQISGNIYKVTGNVNTTYQFKAVSGSGLKSSASDTYTVKLASDVLKAVISDIDSLPDPSGTSDNQITDSEQAIKDAKILYDTLSKDEQSAIGQSRIDKLNHLISRLNAILVIISKDTNTGITANNIGTSVQLPELNDPDVGKVVVKLMVNPIASSTYNNIAVASNSLSNSGSSLATAYDVSLIKSVFDAAGNQTSSGKINNSSITGPIAIRIPVPVEYQGRTDLQVVYIDDTGNVTPLATTLVTINGVRYLQFTATHFSVYAVTAPNEKAASIPNPKTGDTHDSMPDNTAALFSLTFLSTSAAAVAHRKRKKAGHCRHL